MIPYVKAHACGNDFLLVEESYAAGRHAELARKLCSRHTGVGADGVEYMAGNVIRLFNADGSEAEISGNGTRCVAAWLAHKRGVSEIELVTRVGPRACRVLAARDGEYMIESAMGVPAVREHVATSSAGPVEGAIVDMGNPHFVVFVNADDFSCEGMPWAKLGAELALSREFPHGTNVEFVRTMERDAIGIRIYERGVGPTESSGTGTCASAAAAMVLRRAAREMRVDAPGGAQQVRWENAVEAMFLTGPATLIATGDAFL